MAKLQKRRLCSFESLESRLPFAIGNDAYEPNNDPTTAADVGPVGGFNGPVNITGLTMNDGSDWYKFDLVGRMALYSSAQISFTGSQGDLDLYMYRDTPFGLFLVDQSHGYANSESVLLYNKAPGTYYLNVVGYNGATNPNYKLSISSSAIVTSGVGSYTDLIGGSLTSPSLTTTWSQYLTLQSTVRNVGTKATTANFRVEYYLSKDQTYSTDDFLLTQNTAATFNTVGTLTAGGTSPTMTSQVLLPASLPPGWTGTSFFVVMRTDSTNLITESNENNNGGQAGANRDYYKIIINPLGTPTSGFNITLRLTGMTAAQQAVFQAAAARWQEIIWGDLPNANFAGGGGFAAAAVDDILIEGSITPIDGPLGILGQAGPDAFRTGNFLPYHGVMEFDTADIALMTADGSFPSVILHEMGHVLGIGTIWDQRGLLIGAGGADPRFTGVQATWAHDAITATTEPDVPVENVGGGGTADSHWRESVYGSELMTGYAGPGSVLPLSRLTAASMADLLYQINIAKADAFTIPLVAGPPIVPRALMGDADLNGVVDFDDYFYIDSGFMTGGNSWAQGDFDNNGVVDFDDYYYIDTAFANQSQGHMMLTAGVADKTSISTVSVTMAENASDSSNELLFSYAMNSQRSTTRASDHTNVGTSSINTRTSTLSASSRLTSALQTTGLSGLNQRYVTRLAESKDSDLFASHKKELDSLFALEEIY